MPVAAVEYVEPEHVETAAAAAEGAAAAVDPSQMKL